VRAGQLRPLVPAHQTSSALINGHHPGTHQEPTLIILLYLSIKRLCINTYLKQIYNLFSVWAHINSAVG